LRSFGGFVAWERIYRGVFLVFCCRQLDPFYRRSASE